MAERLASARRPLILAGGGALAAGAALARLVAEQAEALAALALAKRHFDRVSFDLIYAREGQSEAEWREELTRALELPVEHVSLYQFLALS